MGAYKTETTVTNDGKIILPKKWKTIYNHKVDILVIDKENKKDKKNEKLNIPSYKCGGKLADFSRQDIYNDRF